MTPISRAISLVLVLGLSLASFSLAAARGQTRAVQAIVICAGAGFQVLHLDAEGNPTGPPHVCPDGAAALVADAPAPIQAELPKQKPVPLAWLAERRDWPRHTRPRPHTRGPPDVI